jgi:predicted transcriptional regulator of viral defense system
MKMKNKIGGLREKGRLQLAQLLHSAPEIITVAHAKQALQVDAPRAAAILAALARRGWLSRIRQGLYVQVPLQATTPEIFPEEPRAIAHEIFQPCYIAGWSAAMHWGLTEQIFNTIFIATTKKVHHRELDLKGIKFVIKTISAKKFFGTQPIWTGRTKIEIADATKTVIDCLDDPAMAGGIRLTYEFLNTYFRSKEKNSALLIEYAEKMHSSTVFKRLGYLLELGFAEETELLAICKAKIKKGYSQLDPNSPGKKLITRWGLFVPDDFAVDSPDDY